MKTNTFIIIACIYSLILSLPAVIAPAFASEYFGKPDPTTNELALFNFLGIYQLGVAYLGFVAIKSTEKATKRGWLLAVAIITIAAEIISFYNLNIRQIPPHKTFIMDMAIWTIFALGALYFWNKEK